MKLFMFIGHFRCNVVPFGPGGPLGAVSMDCDRVVFHEGNPPLPYGAPIISYTQRHSGQHVIPAKVSFWHSNFVFI